MVTQVDEVALFLSNVGFVVNAVFVVIVMILVLLILSMAYPFLALRSLELRFVVNAVLTKPTFTRKRRLRSRRTNNTPVAIRKLGQPRESSSAGELRLPLVELV